jgi:Ca2+:H+ antiporter
VSSFFHQVRFQNLFCEFILLVYIAYLLFQLWSHSHFYDDQYDKKSSRLSSVMKEKNANRRERRISLGRTESMQSDVSRMPDERLKDLRDIRERRISMVRTDSIQSDVSRAPDERFKDRSSSFDRIESQPDFKTANDPGTLYPPRRPFAAPSPLSSGSELTLSPIDTIADSKGIYFQTRPPALRLASGTSVPLVRETSRRYSGYSSADSTVNFLVDDRLEPERSPTIVEAPLLRLPVKKEPQLSWTLTVLLLVLVTAVSPSVTDLLGEVHADTCRSMHRL